jgi:hypothetical protein
MRELQLQQLQGTLLPAAEVEATWSNAILRMRNAMLSIPARIASQFPDPKFAENILRGEIETALRQLQTKGRE